MSNHRQMIVNLPDLTDYDVVDMSRVLTAIADAFTEKHRNQIEQQQMTNQMHLPLEEIENEKPPF